MSEKKENHKKSSTTNPSANPSRKVIYSGYLKKSPPLEKIRSGPKFLSSLLCVSNKSQLQDAEQNHRPISKAEEQEAKKKYYTPVGLKQSKRRFFQLEEYSSVSTGKSYRLMYYANPSASTLIGEVDLSQVTTVVKNPRKNFFDNEFVIQTLHKGKPRDYHLSTETQVEVEDWVRHLAHACRLTVEGSCGKSSSDKSSTSDMDGGVNSGAGNSTPSSMGNRLSQRIESGNFFLGASLTRRGDLFPPSNYPASFSVANMQQQQSLLREKPPELPPSLNPHISSYRNSTPINLTGTTGFHWDGATTPGDASKSNHPRPMSTENTADDYYLDLSQEAALADAPIVASNSTSFSTGKPRAPMPSDQTMDEEKRRRMLYDDPSKYAPPPPATKNHQYYNLQNIMELEAPKETEPKPPIPSKISATVKSNIPPAAGGIHPNEEIRPSAPDRPARQPPTSLTPPEDSWDNTSLQLPQRLSAEKSSSSSEEDSEEENHESKSSTALNSLPLPGGLEADLRPPSVSTIPAFPSSQPKPPSTGNYLDLHVFSSTTRNGVSLTPVTHDDGNHQQHRPPPHHTTHETTYVTINTEATKALAKLLPSDYQ